MRSESSLNDPASRALAVGAILLASLAGALVSLPIGGLVATTDRLPLWDMAGHGWGGVELLEAIRDGRPFELLARLNAQDKWPFGFSLLLLPGLVAGDANFASAAGLSIAAFALVPVLLVVLAWRIERSPAALLAGLAAGALWLGAPLPRVLAALVMRETTGAALTLAALTLFLRAQQRGDLSSWRAAGLGLLALIAVKYNYALVLAIAIALHLALELPGTGRREMLRSLRRKLWPLPAGERRAQAIVALVLALALCAVLRVNAGTALWVLLLAATVRTITVAWRERRSPWAPLTRLAPRERGLAETVVVPLWLWSLSPQPIHPRTVWAFLTNRPGEGSLAPQYYLSAFARDHAATPMLGWIALAAAGIYVLLAGRAGAAAGRALTLAAATGFALVALHPYHEPRFLTATAPLVMLAATMAPIAVVRWLASGTGSFAAAMGKGGWVAAALAVGAVVTAAWPLPDQDRALHERLCSDYSAHSGDPRLAAVVRALARHASSPGPGAAARRVGLLGVSNELSPNLLRWELFQQGRTGVELSDPPPRSRGARRDRPPGARLHDWLERESLARVLVVEVDPTSAIGSSPDFRRYNAWQGELGEVIATDQDWYETAREEFADLGLTLRVHDHGIGRLTPFQGAVTLPDVLRPAS